jgi:NAD(P)-dependent dehydrogenase (short-subunit alcohol dehydrogenase family)
MAARPLDGKVAIVTGAASPIGLGRAIALALVQAGARVAMLDTNKAWLDERVGKRPCLPTGARVSSLARPIQGLGQTTSTQRC